MYISCLKKINNEDTYWRFPERAIVFQLVFILFERYFIQLGVPGSCIYILDVINIYLLLKLFPIEKNKRFNALILMYVVLIAFSVLIAFANFAIYGNNMVFTVLEIRNIFRFVIFFLATACYVREEHVDKIFSIIELHFWVNSLFIVYQYFTYFPPTASWMRGDLLNGFFGNERGGNTFVNVEMLIVTLYIFIKWTKKEEKMIHLLLVLGGATIVSGLIELKAFFIEIAIIYVWYLLCVKKSKREKRLNIIIIITAIVIGYLAIQIMVQEYPWFADTLSINGLLESFTSQSYSTANDLNRFTGVFTISDRMFHGNIIDILFGIGLGNGAVSNIAGRTTAFALKYANSNYSWFQGTYLFVQCGLVGLVLYLGTFVYLFLKKKTNKYKTFSNMVILLSLFLVFYGEALKTDAGYLVYFAIATGFLMYKQKIKKINESEGTEQHDVISNYTSV